MWDVAMLHVTAINTPPTKEPTQGRPKAAPFVGGAFMVVPFFGGVFIAASHVATENSAERIRGLGT